MLLQLNLMDTSRQYTTVIMPAYNTVEDLKAVIIEPETTVKVIRMIDKIVAKIEANGNNRV